ncbi:MAG: YlbF family regulator [Clostridia bacterium]|nr:YlbF family regulator [Clostridia bacterium]
MADVIQIARELGAALQEDARYKALMQARKANDEDEQLQKLIGEFNIIMLNAQQEAEKEDKDEAKLQAYNEQYVEAYKTIMDNENMQAYQAAQSELEAVVNTINGIIAMSLNGEDPATCDPDAQNCTHDCSTCGGCH